MTPLEYTLITLVCMMGSYYAGNYLGKMNGIKSTLEYLDSQGVIELDYEEDEEEND